MSFAVDWKLFLQTALEEYQQKEPSIGQKIYRFFKNPQPFQHKKLCQIIIDKKDDLTQAQAMYIYFSLLQYLSTETNSDSKSLLTLLLDQVGNITHNLRFKDELLSLSNKQLPKNPLTATGLEATNTAIDLEIINLEDGIKTLKTFLANNGQVGKDIFKNRIKEKNQRLTDLYKYKTKEMVLTELSQQEQIYLHSHKDSQLEIKHVNLMNNADYYSLLAPKTAEGILEDFCVQFNKAQYTLIEDDHGFVSIQNPSINESVN